MVVPGAAIQPNWAYKGCGLPDGASSTIGGDFGSTVSRYWLSDRSSMRPPLSAIEPDSRGVSMGTRGDCASASSRVNGLAAGSTGTGAPGVVGVPGAVEPGAVVPGAVVTGGFCGGTIGFCCGMPNQSCQPIRMTADSTMNRR